jgi:hypothetical protein
MLAVDQKTLLSASLRHQEDAEYLLAGSPDQSWHLAGYAVECIRKACLSVDTYRKVLSHELGEDADELLEILLALDAHSSRLHLQGWCEDGSTLAKWRATHRYDSRNEHAADATALVRETGLLHDRTMTALWLAEPFDLESL